MLIKLGLLYGVNRGGLVHDLVCGVEFIGGVVNLRCKTDRDLFGSAQVRDEYMTRVGIIWWKAKVEIHAGRVCIWTGRVRIPVESIHGWCIRYVW